jgi:BirA family biotin operon repressor/biotin-[acetyl-CoA-carboxylase] ligase
MNLYATFYFKHKGQNSALSTLAQVMATSLASLLLQEGFSPQIKWPNDVLLRRKKVAGILCELLFDQEFVEVLLGVGVNLNMEAEDSAKISQPVTSLKMETGKTWKRDLFLQKLGAQFEKDVASFFEQGFAPFRPFFESLWIHRGEALQCFDGTKTWEGVGHSITDQGQLCLKLADGSLHTFSSGDVTGRGSPANSDGL